jgi:hypothetical protein
MEGHIVECLEPGIALAGAPDLEQRCARHGVLA